MYPYTEEHYALSPAEVETILRQAILEALTEYPDYSAVAVKVQNEEQRKLAIQWAKEQSEELADKCLRAADRVVFITQTADMPLGKIRLFENYLNAEARERKDHA